MHNPEQSGQADDTASVPAVDPRELAKAVAREVAEDPSQVGDVVDAIDLGDGVTDFRIAAAIKGYEGWQWSVTLYHDAEVGTWTVNESSLIPTDQALMPPAWIPWKDRLEPTDLAPTDSIGTDPDDPRLEEGFRRTESAVGVAGEDGEGAQDVGAAEEQAGADESDADAAAETTDDVNPQGDAVGDTAVADTSVVDDAAAENDDVEEAVEEFDLSRRHVLSPLGRAQTAQRWYDGPRGPKALSTKTASGNLCSTCGFFVPLQGELNLLFGVCANKWSPDDGRVVSLDHGCGEHSEIEPPEPSRLWVQSKPAFDDLHIDIIAQKPREEKAQIEILEQEEPENVPEDTPEDADAPETDEVTERDIEENTEIDADSPDVEENTVDPGDGPELESVVDLTEDAPDDAGTTDADDTSDTDDVDVPDIDDAPDTDDAQDTADALETDGVQETADAPDADETDDAASASGASDAADRQ
ncbi:DUF3027 domain-containing protein [Bifidobacterium aesculapii]|uniref:DUF3027 domain-containing protein n=1 Tax=Bifidobacterium aesculapii TaxID=1329411 RepID=UPI00128F2C52|nr:DUF3027 domain-containing protein [Bifidobacterium aesculapii]